MPIDRIISIGKESQLTIWHLTESIDELQSLIQLSNSDQETLNLFRLDKRKKEWIAGRIILQELLNEYPQIHYTQSGKPYLSNNNLHISISHTNGYVAVCKSNLKTAVDIEICTERVEKVADRFIHPNEWLFIKPKNQLEYLTVIWSAKETLYKLFDEQGVIFKEHFEIQPFTLDSEGEINATYSYLKQSEKIILNYRFTPEYAMVYHLKA